MGIPDLAYFINHTDVVDDIIASLPQGLSNNDLSLNIESIEHKGWMFADNVDNCILKMPKPGEEYAMTVYFFDNVNNNADFVSIHAQNSKDVAIVATIRCTDLIKYYEIYKSIK